MTNYTLKERMIPCDDSWDVLVVGGGPAGCAAAAASAREGAKTLLVETTGALGGMGTSGLVPAWCPFTDKERIIYGGLAERVLKTCMAGMPHVPKTQYTWTPIDAELLKRIYDDLMIEHGVTVSFNTFMASVEGDANGGASVSKALMQGRKIAKAFRDACAEFLPEAFGNAHLTSTGSLLGVRETRRIVGDYVLTMDDYVARRSFPDEICRHSYPIDIHTTKVEAEEGTVVEAMFRFENYGKGASHGIPYRCLTPRGLKNLLVAGRSISTDRTVQASTRVMPVCLAMGEAAGIAAAMAVVTENGDVHAVDTDRLRTTLKEKGAYLP